MNHTIGTESMIYLDKEINYPNYLFFILNIHKLQKEYYYFRLRILTNIHNSIAYSGKLKYVIVPRIPSLRHSKPLKGFYYLT